MVVTHSNSTQEKWQIENLHNFFKTKYKHKKNPYPLLFIDEKLNIITWYMAYCFLDGYSRYHQIYIALEERYKIIFVTY
jgi:hypothetical protein